MDCIKILILVGVIVVAIIHAIIYMRKLTTLRENSILSIDTPMLR